MRAISYDSYAPDGSLDGLHLSDLPEPKVAPGTALGLSLQTLTPQIARAINVPATVRGVVVTSVDPNSDASEKGIRRGDVILSVNRQAVTTPAAVLSAVDVARRAGVNKGTVSRALRGMDGVGEETRQRIMAAVGDMNPVT